MRATLLFLACSLAAATAAPVPAPKAKKAGPKAKAAPAFVGAWRMTWGGGSGDVVFSADGGYWCLWAGQQWVGEWRVEGGKLHVVEGRAVGADQVPGDPLRWLVDLDLNTLAGEVDHGGSRFAFKLERPEELKAPGGER